MKIAMAIALSGAAGLASGQVLINEVQPNPSGSDPSTQLIELRGTAGATFSGVLYSLDTDFASGSVDREFQISGTFDSNGLLTVEIDDLENPSFTLVLATNSGLLDSTVDANEDGILDLDFGTVFDAIGVTDDGDDNDFSFADELGGLNIAFTGDEPGLIFRDALDSSVIYAINDPAGEFAFDQFGNAFSLASGFFTADGVAVDLSGVDPEVITTFGGVNFTTIPAPGTLALVGLGGLAAARRRR